MLQLYGVQEHLCLCVYVSDNPYLSVYPLLHYLYLYIYLYMCQSTIIYLFIPCSIIYSSFPLQYCLSICPSLYTVIFLSIHPLQHYLYLYLCLHHYLSIYPSLYTIFYSSVHPLAALRIHLSTLAALPIHLSIYLIPQFGSRGVDGYSRRPSTYLFKMLHLSARLSPLLYCLMLF